MVRHAQTRYEVHGAIYSSLPHVEIVSFTIVYTFLTGPQSILQG